MTITLVKLKNIQQSFNLWTEQLPEDNPLKPTDLKRINYGIVQLENFIEKAEKLRNSVEQNDASAFSKAGKLKSGQECAHKFNENYFGAITSLKKETQERLTRMQSLKYKLKRMYPMIKEGSISKKRRKKENRTRSNKRKMEHEEKGCQRVFPAVVKNELSYGNIVETNFLNEDAVAKLGKRDVKWLNCYLKKACLQKKQYKYVIH